MYAYLGLIPLIGSPPVILFATLSSISYSLWMVGNPIPYSYETFIFNEYTSPMTFFQRIMNTLHYFNHIHFNPIWNKHEQLMKKTFNYTNLSLKSIAQNISLIYHYRNEICDEVRIQVPAIINVGGLHIGQTDQNLSKEVS